MSFQKNQQFLSIILILVSFHWTEVGKILWLIDGVVADISMIRDNNEFFVARKNNLNLDDQFFKYGIRGTGIVLKGLFCNVRSL